VEVEAFALDVSTRRPVPPTAESPTGRAISPVLEAWAREREWRAVRTAAGSPGYADPDGRTVSFEPGGQLEYASAPVASLERLESDLHDVVPSLAAALAADGIELVARGVDPATPLPDAPLWVSGERYRRMAAHYARRGPWGRRMMRQTAALHINLDAPGPPFEAWAVANAAVPALLAAFANSPVVEGRASGHRSARAAQWRSLDPTRTGIADGAGDPVDEYLDFALGADAFLLGQEGEAARSFESLLDEATPEDWHRHLTTLFPEVRPRGYLEVRGVDTLPLHLVPLPVALLVGLLFDDRTRTRARTVLPRPDLALLERAGRLGLADREVADRVDTVFELGIAGLRSLPPEVAGPDLADRLERFRSSFTDAGLDPGHRSDDRLVGEVRGFTGG
jgi:glutamate--cysteine ligase